MTAITRDKCIIRFAELTKRAPAAANLTFVYLRSILNHAREKFADEDGNPTVLTTNPVTRMLKKEHLNAEKPRTRRIALADVGKAWFALTQVRAKAKRAQDRTSVDLVCLRMLTGDPQERIGRAALGSDRLGREGHPAVARCEQDPSSHESANEHGTA
ncbi:MAG: hypothetical protein WDM77_09725 [Steroidobacteraceae bacterium]